MNIMSYTLPSLMNDTHSLPDVHVSISAPYSLLYSNGAFMNKNRWVQVSSENRFYSRIVRNRQKREHQNGVLFFGLSFVSLTGFEGRAVR